MNKFKIYEYKEKASGLFGFFKRKSQKVPLGEIIFHNDKVLLAGREIPLDELQRISFAQFQDYAGRNDEGKVSEGNNNVVELYWSNSVKEVCCFALEKRYQLRDVKQQLIAYYKAGKLDFENLILILGLEDYNAVQNFKNSLLATKDGKEV
ncbi:hypothetical protein FUA48_18235 [Flavobacterium alkalisoli]|uniref:Uncharacterized protein n=1 Tax=Flavobacterium alkalisoli TaxID=2602769 RepID=A0A5B9FZB6_9FLAO|nr:hypothetical protein [Flavobacterium alkalisoli]QEE51436.1 hypothetical protein FUA48_18235 [Flavobacterium alkalisoli]